MKNTKITAAALAALLMLTGCGRASEDNTPVEKANCTAAATQVSDDGDYVYCLASVSKIYSTAAVMQLVDEGKVELDTPITEYIPDFRMADERYKDITVRMLMDHTSGIMGSTFRNAQLYDDNDTYYHDHLLESLSTQRLKADPGKYAAYCNDGFTLLEMITENVSGMTFTEYVKKNISEKTGAEMTGTGLDMFRSENIVPSVASGRKSLDDLYCMCFGSGGIFATASDTAKFGASFFTGDGTLLSEQAKNAMATRQSDNEYCDNSGLGWDYAEMLRYKENGVKVVGKGGDVGLYHSWLWCAPDEQISVAVLSNGGSSELNALVGSAILDAALGTKGIEIHDAAQPETEVLTEIPPEYTRFAGKYFMSVSHSGSCAVCEVSFPENKYLHMEATDHLKTTCTDYALTADGDFAELAYEVAESGFDKQLAGGNNRISFEETDGSVYIRSDSSTLYPGIGSVDMKQYSGERVEDSDVGEDVLSVYEALDGKELLLCCDKYSSDNYENGILQLRLTDKLRGYVFAVTGQGCRLVKMTDSAHLTAPFTVPSSANRDLLDAAPEFDGSKVTGVALSNGERYICGDDIPEFDSDVKSVTIEENAAWYRISDSIANTPVTVTRPENSAVYVYNKFGEVIYTSHNKNAKPQIPMPKGGKVLFLGEKGAGFEIRS